MVVPAALPVTVLLLIILPGVTFCPTATSARAGGHGHKHHQVVPTSSFKPRPVCSGLRVTPPSSHRGWLPLYHRRGPCSPLRAGAARRKVSTAEILRRDQLRVDDIRRKVSSGSGHGNSSTHVTVPANLGASLRTLEYVVTVGLGTPAVSQTVMFDTGGDLSWVQCRPCPTPACHPQKDPLFDPARSTTYSPFTCRSAACARLRQRSCSRSRSGECKYVIMYADGSNTSGTYSSDDLTLASSSGDVVAGFRFGCSHVVQGDTDLTDGLIGLGGGADSLVSQMGEKAFSYCLPPTASDAGFLTLGVPRVASSRYVVTPMYRIKGAATFHLVRLQAIAVAGRRLDVPPAAFSGGLVLDSGTIITRLSPTAYRALRAAFRKEMKMYEYPRTRPKSILDTCYNLTGAGAGDVKVPRVSLVFDRGAAVELDPSGIIVQSCLAFAPTDGDGFTGIVGNVQQRTLEVLYDVGGGAVGFRRGAC